MVSWDDRISNPVHVKYGVPQGSVLETLLFLGAINDLYYEMGIGFLLVADDTTLSSSHADLHTAVPGTREFLISHPVGLWTTN